MPRLHGIEFEPGRIGEACRRAGVVRVFLFGSILTDRFGPDSDVDILVETDPCNPPGLLKLGGLQMDLSDMLGRTVHLTLPAVCRPANAPECWPVRGCWMPLESGRQDRHLGVGGAVMQ